MPQANFMFMFDSLNFTHWPAQNGFETTTYKVLIALSKVLLPDAKLSISKTIESLANEKAKKLNGKIKKI